MPLDDVCYWHKADMLNALICRVGQRAVIELRSFMILGDPRLRCLGKALALASMIFYAVLVPWHTVSQATAGVVERYGTSAQPPCNQALTKTGVPSKQSAPSGPRTKCPICNGFGALHLAVGAPVILIVLRTRESEELPTLIVPGVAECSWRAPQCRGPPALPA